MTDLDSLFSFLRTTSSSLSFPTAGIILFFLWKEGLISLKRNGNGNGNGNGYQRQIDEIKQEVVTLRDNHIAHLQSDVSAIKADISYIRGKLDK